VINPLTGRFIKVGEPTYLNLIKTRGIKCVQSMSKHKLGPWNKQWSGKSRI
jgi:hypothetical protein